MVWLCARDVRGMLARYSGMKGQSFCSFPFFNIDMGGNKEERRGGAGGGGRPLVQCPRHPHEQSSLVGICPYCLRDRLTVLAQLRQAEEEKELSGGLHHLHQPQLQITNRHSSPSPLLLHQASPSCRKTRVIHNFSALSNKQEARRYEFPQAVPENGEVVFSSSSHRRSLSVPNRRNYCSDGEKPLHPPRNTVTTKTKLKKKSSFWASLFHRENRNRTRSKIAIADAEAGRRSTAIKDNPEVIIEEEFFQTEAMYEYVEVDQSHRSSSSSTSSSWMPYILLMWRRKRNRYGKDTPPSIQESNRSSVDAVVDQRPSVKQHRRSIFRRHGVFWHHAEESSALPDDNIPSTDTPSDGHLSDSHVVRKPRYTDNPLHNPPLKHHYRHSRAIQPEAYQSEDDSFKTFKSTWNKAFSPSLKHRHSKEEEETEAEEEEDDDGDSFPSNLHHFHHHHHNHHLQGCPLSPTPGSKSQHPSFLNRDYSAFSFYFSPGREPVSGVQKPNNVHHCSPYTSDGGGSSKATPLHHMKRSNSRKA